MKSREGEADTSFGRFAKAARHPKPSAPDIIAAALREAIISGALSGGRQLRQVELAAEFGVSVIPVREALRQLAAEGFVVSHPNRGAVVARIVVDEVRELFDIRVALETILLTEAIPLLTDTDLETATKCERAFENETDANLWGQRNWAFHEALYRSAGRKRTLSIVANVNDHIDRILRLQMSILDGKKRSRPQHRRILQACRKRNVKEAVALLVDHIRGVENIILAYAAKKR